jgi:hypothetical protein
MLNTSLNWSTLPTRYHPCNTESQHELTFAENLQALESFIPVLFSLTLT